MDWMEMVDLPVVPALINAKRVKEIVTVMQTAKVILDVGKAVEMMTIATLALDFLDTMTVATTQVWHKVKIDWKKIKFPSWNISDGNEIDSYSWHFIAFSFDSFNGKGLFVVDQKVGFDMIKSDGSISSGKGIHFNVDSSKWIAGKSYFQNM